MPNVDSWKTYHPIPAAIHAHLYAHPHIKLRVICSATRPFHTRLYEAALSSPSLHTLCYTLFYHFSTRDTPSEFHAFKTCVAQATRLKALTLNIRGTNSAAHYAPGPLHLQFEVDDTFPALEELTFAESCYDRYVLSAAHCAAWVRAMDWGRLRALDLGHATSLHLLPALMGKIPRLKTLRMGFWPNSSGPRASWSSAGGLGVMTRFVEGIEALKNVTLYTGDDTQCAQVRSALLRKHGRGMKNLIIWLGMREAWKPAHFADLRVHAPGLQKLDVPAEMYQERKKRASWSLLVRLRKDNGRPYERSCWPTEVQRTLCSFKELRQLTLRVQLKYDSYQFVPDALTEARSAINDEFAKKTALALFEGFGNNAAIELLKLVFLSKEPGKAVWTYTVRRLWVANEMKYGVVVDRTVDGEDAEERRRSELFDPFG
jgi:hypothetical protein